MRITSKGQVTIPIEIREKLGLMPGSEVTFVLDGRAVKIVKARQGHTRGEIVVEHLRGRGSVRMSTDQIMALTRGRR